MSAVTITRFPLTTPCPVPVTPAGESIRDGEPIPMGERTELCAVDAEWMIGGQRLCDVHLRETCALVEIDFEDVVREVFEPYGLHSVALAFERFAEPWSARTRYSQKETREWHERAKEHGLA